MRVYELIERLRKYDPSAIVKFINQDSVAIDVKYDGYGGGDGCTPLDCDEVYLSCPDYKENLES